MERQFKSIEIEPDLSGVIIKFTQTAIPADHDEREVEEDELKTNTIKVEGKHEPHDDFVKAFRNIRQHGHAILGIDLGEDKKQLANWQTLGIKISGNIDMQQARVKVKLGLKSELTGKISTIETGQVTLYPKQEDAVKYAAGPAFTKVVENLVARAEDYLNGVYGDDDENQLPLFPKVEKAEA